MKTRDTPEALIVETTPKSYPRIGWYVGEDMPKFEATGVGPCVACGLAGTLDKATRLEVHCWRAWRFGSRA